MGYHPRIETADFASFLTTRSRNSEVWFVNNRPLEEAILGYGAKYQQRYGVTLYGLAIEGNHIQATAHFPQLNRASFMRDLNSSIARAIPNYCPKYAGGRFWQRRYSAEYLPGKEDIEEWFFYTALQPIQDGLVERLSEYPSYNCFYDAVHGIERTVKVVRWKEYHNAKRRNPEVLVRDFTDSFSLRYSRLPGYEDLSREEYVKLMYQKLEIRRREIVRKRKEKGLGFLGREKLLQTKPGSRPRKTKTSNSSSHRPRVLSICARRRKFGLAWYFSIYRQFKKASQKFRRGDFSTAFPEGTYRPPVWLTALGPPLPNACA